MPRGWFADVTVPSEIPRFAVLGIAALVVLAALAALLYQSLLSGPSVEPAARWDLAAYSAVLGDGDFWSASLTTLILAIVMTVIAVPIGAVMAFVVVRTDVPGRHWLEPLIVVPIFMPGIAVAIGYAVALGQDGVPTTDVAFSFGSLMALSVIAGLTHVPCSYLCAVLTLRGIGAEIEEAARIAGAKPWKAAIDVSLPMASPALMFAAALVFVLGIQSLGLPLVLGEPNGVTVLTTYLYKFAGQGGVPRYPAMAAVAVVIFAVALPLVFVQRLLLRTTQGAVPPSRSRMRITPLRLGRWRWPAFAAIALWLLLASIVPVGALVIRSLLGGTGASQSITLTPDHYLALLDHPHILRAIGNTLGIGVFGGAAAIACYAAIAQAMHRWPSRWARVADYGVTAVRALPGIATGLAVLLLLLWFDAVAPFKATAPAIWVAYLLAWLGYGVPLVSHTLRQVNPELEEAARNLGADGRRVTRDVTLPLIRHAVLVGWLLVFLVFVREYATAVLLLAPGNEVIGAMLVSLWSEGAVDLLSVLAVLNVVTIGAGLALLAAIGVRTHG
jgi:iron(III) transport system permease protein